MPSSPILKLARRQSLRAGAAAVFTRLCSPIASVAGASSTSRAVSLIPALPAHSCLVPDIPRPRCGLTAGPFPDRSCADARGQHDESARSDDGHAGRRDFLGHYAGHRRPRTECAGHEADLDRGARAYLCPHT
jgi:hypothetical protein